MPMEIAPAISSAIPPKMTSFESPRDERPAVKADGTVSPSERPMPLYGGALAHTSKVLGVGDKSERTHLGQYLDRRAYVQSSSPVDSLQHTPCLSLSLSEQFFARVRWAGKDQELPHGPDWSQFL